MNITLGSLTLLYHNYMYGTDLPPKHVPVLMLVELFEIRGDAAPQYLQYFSTLLFYTSFSSDTTKSSLPQCSTPPFPKCKWGYSLLYVSIA